MLCSQMLVYTEGFEESIGDIVIEEGSLELHGEVQSTASQPVNAQEDQVQCVLLCLFICFLLFTHIFGNIEGNGM